MTADKNWNDSRRCDKCATPKPMRGGLAVAKVIGMRHVRTWVCFDCLLAHIAKVRREWPASFRTGDCDA